jgi:ubiquinone/menaquinone biosynthesis C-methylase UbiE
MSESGFQVGRDAPMFYEAQVGRFMAPFVEALVDSTVRPADAVLDVACGTGFATRAAALVAGPGARVEGADLNPAMVAQARTVPDTSGANLQWCEASGLDLPYGDGEFDAVICQQGLQFFPDPAAGVREMARVTRAGGRLGLTVWSPSEQSPFLDSETAMLARHGGGAQASYSTTESQLRSWFADSGLRQVVVELLKVEVDLPPVLTYVPEHLKALPWSAGFFALPEEQQQAALAELDKQLAEYRTDDGLRIPFSSYVATATV